MSVVEVPVPPPVPGPSPQEAAWWFAEGEAVAVMGTVNVAVARLVAAVRGLLDTDGWEGVGIQSPEHWLCWKANLSRARADGLVTIARRLRDLPECWALFEAGRLGEDAMVRIARRVPATRDAEVAALAPQLLIAQLDRLVRSLPEQADGASEPRPEPERVLRLRDGRDGWLRGQFCLPADEGALVRLGLTSARDAEFRDRNDLPQPDPDDDSDPVEAAGARSVTWADGLVRMASEAADALDPTYRRTGQRGERNTVVVHIDVAPDGTLGPAQLDMGPVVPDPLARFLSCDAHMQVMAYRLGQLIGIHPTQRTPNRAMRRYLARRDQGCTHPLCTQRLWLHAHHIVHWEHGGPTVPHNLLLLCPRHHRALHLGEYSIVGNPETGSVRFLDRWGQPLAPPRLDPPDPGPSRSGRPPPDRPPPPPYTPPLAERLTADTFTWN
jgi:Domain of unknown function (DUF222)/HNH endonuclease